MSGHIFQIIIFVFFLAAPYKALSENQSNGASHAIKASIDSLNNQGYKMVRNNAAKALLMFVKAERLSIKHHYDNGLAAAYVNQAEVFSQRGYAKRALLFYYQAMAVSERNHDEYHIAQCEQHISTVKRNSGEYEEARRLLNHSLAVYTRLNKPIDVVNAVLRLGILAVSQKQYTAANQWYTKAYQASKMAGYQYGEKKTYYDWGLLNEELHKSASAISYFNRALVIDSITHDDYGKALSYLEISRVYFTGHRSDLAKRYANLSFIHANNVGANDLSTKAADLLVNIYRQDNNLTGVIEWQNRLLAVSKQLSNQEKKDAVTFIDVLREEQENQTKYLNRIDTINKVSKEKTLLLVFSFAVLVVIVMLLISLNYNYRKATAYAKELELKKQQVEEKSRAVEALNHQVIVQNQSLEQDNNLKSKLLSVISHDLRHPLVNTQSLLSIYNQSLMSEEEAKDLFSQLEAQYARTITLLDNLLFWIKRQVQHEPAPKTINMVSSIINDLTEEQKLSLSNKHIVVSNKVDPDLTLHTDREALRIVLRNLLNNALKFTPDNGTIEFISNIDADSYHITVKDNGIGMGPSKLKKVIEGSYLSTKGTSGEMGSGFGLILVRDLIGKDNGTLEIDSTPGTGSQFTITFPKEKVAGAA